MIPERTAKLIRAAADAPDTAGKPLAIDEMHGYHGGMPLYPKGPQANAQPRCFD